MTEETITLLKRLRTFHNGTYAKAIDEAIASAEPKKGKWKVFYDDDSPQDGFEACSECGFIRYHEDIFPRNYCPNCGAKMEVE